MVFVRGISKRISKAIVVSKCNFRYHFCMSFYALVKRKYKYYYIEIFILYFSKVNMGVVIFAWSGTYGQ